MLMSKENVSDYTTFDAGISLTSFDKRSPFTIKMVLFSKCICDINGAIHKATVSANSTKDVLSSKSFASNEFIHLQMQDVYE